VAKLKACPVCGQNVGLDKLEAHVKRVHPKEKVELGFDEQEVKEVRQARKAAKPSVSSSGRWIALVAVLLVVVVVLAVIFLPKGLGVGDPAPDFTLTDTLGANQPWNLNSHINPNRPILLEFFHPDCDACKKAIPDTKTIFQRYGASIEMVSVAITLEVPGFRNPPTVATALEFKNSVTGQDWTFIVETSGTAVRDLYKVTSTPTFYLISTDGKIAYKQLGDSPGNTAALEAAITKAIP